MNHSVKDTPESECRALLMKMDEDRKEGINKTRLDITDGVFEP